MLVDRNNGRPVRKLQLCADDGRALTAADTTLKPRPETLARNDDQNPTQGMR
jgi:hypothetical protein